MYFFILFFYLIRLRLLLLLSPIILSLIYEYKRYSMELTSSTPSSSSSSSYVRHHGDGDGGGSSSRITVFFFLVFQLMLLISSSPYTITVTALSTAPIIPVPIIPVVASTPQPPSILPRDHELYDAYQKFQAWKDAGTIASPSSSGNTTNDTNGMIVQEFHVEQEDIDHYHDLYTATTQTASTSNSSTSSTSTSNNDDNENTTTGEDDLKSIRISLFASRICFPESLLSTNAANVACQNGEIRVNTNHEKVYGSYRVKVDDVIFYTDTKAQLGDRRTNLPKPKSNNEDGTPNIDRAVRFLSRRWKLYNRLIDPRYTHSPLQILYEDHVCAIVCKPAGIHTISYQATYGNSICFDELLPLLLQPPTLMLSTDTTTTAKPASSSSSSSSTDDTVFLLAPQPVHRLDRRVAGPVVIAKTRRALVELSKAFRLRSVVKEYRALVVGGIDTTTYSNKIN